MRDFLSLPEPEQLLLSLNVFTPGRKVGFLEESVFFLVLPRKLMHVN